MYQAPRSRFEKFGVRTVAGQAKIAGTVAGLGGAMILTFYKGPDINIWTTTINILKHNQHQGTAQHGWSSDRVAGSLLAIASCLSTSVWMIIQAKMANAYPCHYSSTALMCLMGAIQATTYALCLNRDMSQWRLGFDIRLLGVFYCVRIHSLQRLHAHNITIIETITEVTNKVICIQFRFMNEC